MGFYLQRNVDRFSFPFLSVGLVGDPDHGIASMRSNGQKMIIRMGGRN